MTAEAGEGGEACRRLSKGMEAEICTSGPGVEAPKVIQRKGVSRNEKFINKECVKSTALIM